MPPKKSALSLSEQVSQHIQSLEPALAEAVQYIRELILATDEEVGEQIKWNSVSFYYTGEMQPFDPKEYKRDIVVINLNKGNMLLIFPTGAVIDNASGILEGDYKDGRRMIRFKDLADVKSKEKSLQMVVKAWLSKVDR